MKPSENPRRDKVRSVFQCEATHGSYTRCTLNDDHTGPHRNDSYVWEDVKPVVPVAAALTTQERETLLGRITRIVEPEGQKAEGDGESRSHTEG